MIKPFPTNPDDLAHIADEISAAQINQSLAGLSILIVDDYADSRDLLHLVLSSLEIQVVTAQNGQQALQELEQATFDIVLMDCEMPTMDGFEATRRLRQMEGDTQHTIVIGVTAHSLNEEQDACLQAGMDDHLSKPVTIEVLTAAISHWQHHIRR